MISTARTVSELCAGDVCVGSGTHPGRNDCCRIDVRSRLDIPADQLSNAQIALGIVGLNLALSFPLQIFDGYLWAAQRFDILNVVDIPAAALRVLMTFALVKDPGDIVVLSVITLVTQAGSGIVKGVISFRSDRFLRIRASLVSRGAARALFGYGWWNFVLTIARLTKTQLSPILIASVAGVAQVTPFSIARRLQDYAHKVLWTATGVIVPVATGFHARSESEQQQRLFIEGGKYSASAALFLVSYLVCVGRPLIALWMGPEFAYVAVLLAILSIGELVQMTQSLTGSIVLATARHKTLAWMAVIETVREHRGYSSVLCTIRPCRGLSGAGDTAILPEWRGDITLWLQNNRGVIG